MMDLVCVSEVKESRLAIRDPLPSSQILGQLVVAGGPRRYQKKKKEKKNEWEITKGQMVSVRLPALVNRLLPAYIIQLGPRL